MRVRRPSHNLKGHALPVSPEAPQTILAGPHTPHLQAGAALQQARHHGVPLELLELLVQVEVRVAVVQRHH